MKTTKPIPGQRWVSDSEPELGLGIILKADSGRVELFFPAAEETRQYAIESAPLRRVQFNVGDKITTHTGEQCEVDAVNEENGLLLYRSNKKNIPEAELSDLISFTGPEERLLAGQVDSPADYHLRTESLNWRSVIRHSPVRGFMGGRIDLIPHQIAIATEVTSRLLPRVLLADEVGLGKTIEAGLILHRLNLTGRAGRILILIPEPLVNQWFVEMLRRFNLLFSVFDRERCEAIELNNPEANPFLESQLTICPIEFFASDTKRTQQIAEASWDLLIVDEAHHLQWTPSQSGPAYRLVETLAAKVPGLLLLTATPQQLGVEGHFARLRLLDPDRYTSLERFLKESKHYDKVASAIDRLTAGKKLSAKDITLFTKESSHLQKQYEALAAGDETLREPLIHALLDEFGTGRVLFRNTRDVLTGFPKRKVSLIPIKSSGDTLPEKVRWFITLLKKLKTQKVLVICATRSLAEQVSACLQEHIKINSALFHEGLTLLQRDRNAAYFAEEDGARVLICSEIGSEGRNFQFVQHLVLFDLPKNPELLEQRIGRLDRIGQKNTISIHVPYIPETESEVLVRWYHEGLNAFEKNLNGAQTIVHTLDSHLKAALAKFDAKALARLIEESKSVCKKIATQLAAGHDRLIALNSARPGKAKETMVQIQKADTDLVFEKFAIRLLDHLGVAIEDHSIRSYLLSPGIMLKEALPGLPPEGCSVTFERTRALSREELGFITQDHPLVRGALDLLLGGEVGNASFGIFPNAKKESLLLEVQWIIECIAPPHLHIDRFLPPTPIRILVDHAQNDLTEKISVASLALESGDVFRLLDKSVVKNRLIPKMLGKTKELAAVQMEKLVTHATLAMEQQLQAEIKRLESLSARNDHIRIEEIDALRVQKQALLEALKTARLRVDALCLVLQTA